MALNRKLTHLLKGRTIQSESGDEGRPHDPKIETSFREAIGTAREQKSVSLEKRAETTYAEYRRQKASVSGGRGFRLPLC